MSSQEPIRPEAITRYLSTDRFGTYLRYSAQSPAAALTLYEWNSRLAGELMTETGIVEVLVRNAMDQHLSAWADQRGTVHWWEIAALDVRGRHDLDQASERATRRQGAQQVTPHGKVVAELSFGFWRFLCARRYLTDLWIPALHSAFPYAATDPRKRRKDVEQNLQQLTYVRNRAAHHEPLFRRDLARDHDLALQTIGWIDPCMPEWLTSQSHLPVLLRRRPSAP